MPRLERLESDDERDLSFDCGDADLNEFFFYDSKLVCRELIAVTYAWTDNDQTLSYFSISNDAIAREVDKAAYRRAARNIPHAKRFMTLPAVKIGRLAVDKRFQSNGVGSAVIDFIKGWFTEGNKTGCRFIVVDALNNPDTLKFYSKNGFLYLNPKDEKDKTRLMYFDLVSMLGYSKY
jgi:GNAT superfamily N-acetyltransferase